MDPSLKKRKADDNNGIAAADASPELTVDDALKILAPFTADQLRPILAAAVLRDPQTLSAVRSLADPDQSLRKLFIRGLGWDTTADSLRSLFSSFGDLEEAVVISDKQTGKSKGYGFITFRHVDAALLALKEPSKKIDGRMTVTQLAAAGNSANNSGLTAAADVSLRKIYVANVPADMPSDRLLHLFSTFGEIEEGPLGFDKQTGKFRGFALFVYKTPEAAQACLVEPNKMIDGHHLVCKLAIEGKKPKVGGPGGPGGPVTPGQGVGDGMGYGSQMPGQYGGPGAVGVGSYGGFSGGGYPSGGGGAPVGNHSMNSSTMGGGNAGQIPAAHGGAGAGGYGAGGYGAGGGGYGAGSGGPYGGSAAAQYGGGGAGTGGAVGGGYGGGYGMNSSMYRVPPSSGGMGAGGYAEGGSYPSGGYQNQHHQQTGTSPGARVPSGGMYQNIPPFY